MSENTLMYHFAAVDKNDVPRLGYGDGREVRIGETLTVYCTPVVCSIGLHACPKPLDALKYVSEHVALCAVRLGGTVVQGNENNVDKYAATERTVVAMLSAAETNAMLREFARWCALQVAHLWEMPDVVRRYLETGDETIRAAAWAAAWAAWAAWDARAAWDAWDAWDARDAWDAWAALITSAGARLGWLRGVNPARHTTGLLEAYQSGLAVAFPTGPDELGWAMEPAP